MLAPFCQNLKDFPKIAKISAKLQRFAENCTVFQKIKHRLLAPGETWGAAGAPRSRPPVSQRAPAGPGTSRPRPGAGHSKERCRSRRRRRDLHRRAWSTERRRRGIRHFARDDDVDGGSARLWIMPGGVIAARSAGLAIYSVRYAPSLAARRRVRGVKPRPRRRARLSSDFKRLAGAGFARPDDATRF